MTQTKKKRTKTVVLSALAVLLVGTVIVCAVYLLQIRKLDTYEVQSLAAVKLTEQDVHLIAHRGLRATAPENTLPAFTQAGEAEYWGAECDTYRTKDGTWVVHHDYDTYRMMNKRRVIEKTSLHDLFALHYNNGNGIEKYTDLRICTLEEYLAECAKYQMHPVIELKGKHNLEHYDEIIELVKKYQCGATYISFEFEDLQALRKLTDAPLYLLVTEITDDAIAQAKTLENCGISYQGTKKENLADNGAMIQKIHAAGLPSAAWTIDDVVLVKQLLSYGTSDITTDCITYE